MEYCTGIGVAECRSNDDFLPLPFAIPSGAELHFASDEDEKGKRGPSYLMQYVSVTAWGIYTYDARKISDSWSPPVSICTDVKFRIHATSLNSSSFGIPPTSLPPPLEQKMNCITSNVFTRACVAERERERIVSI